jgi:hypothetical protein
LGSSGLLLTHPAGHLQERWPLQSGTARFAIEEALCCLLMRASVPTRGHWARV